MPESQRRFGFSLVCDFPDSTPNSSNLHPNKGGATHGGMVAQTLIPNSRRIACRVVKSRRLNERNLHGLAAELGVAARPPTHAPACPNPTKEDSR
jgi:hypothetical protein